MYTPIYTQVFLINWAEKSERKKRDEKTLATICLESNVKIKRKQTRLKANGPHIIPFRNVEWYARLLSPVYLRHITS